jgi:signal transduction histidine kinase
MDHDPRQAAHRRSGFHIVHRTASSSTIPGPPGAARARAVPRRSAIALRHLQTREEERARIAREVHDELGSTLTGLRIDLDRLIDHDASSRRRRHKKHAAMLSLLESAVAATRKIVTDLRPAFSM